MIKNIIFDIGNVLLDFHPEVYFNELDEGAEVCKYIFTHKEWNLYDRGENTFQEVLDLLVSEKPEYEKQIRHILEHWLSVLKPKHYAIEKLKELKAQGYGIYLLSNLALESTNHVGETYGLFDMAHGYVVSYQVNLCKPEAAIYKHLLDRFDLKAEECLFLDDLEANIIAAKVIGMKGIVYVNDEQVNRELQEVLDKDKYVK